MSGVAASEKQFRFFPIFIWLGCRRIDTLSPRVVSESLNYSSGTVDDFSNTSEIITDDMEVFSFSRSLDIHEWGIIISSSKIKFLPVC